MGKTTMDSSSTSKQLIVLRSTRFDTKYWYQRDNFQMIVILVLLVRGQFIHLRTVDCYYQYWIWYQILISNKDIKFHMTAILVLRVRGQFIHLRTVDCYQYWIWYQILISNKDIKFHMTAILVLLVRGQFIHLRLAVPTCVGFIQMLEWQDKELPWDLKWEEQYQISREEFIMTWLAAWIPG